MVLCQLMFSIFFKYFLKIFQNFPEFFRIFSKCFFKNFSKNSKKFSVFLQKIFDMDFGPSLLEEMEEAFGVINGGHCGHSETLSTITDFKFPTSPPVLHSASPVSRKPSDPISSAKPSPPIPAKVLRPIEISPQPLQKSPENPLPTKPPPPPAKPPKPQALTRKKLDPISVVQEESEPLTNIKPASPRDERLIDNFIDSSTEFAARSVALHSNGPSFSPAATASKSRFSFRGFRSKSTAEPAVERPKIFLAVEPPRESSLEEPVTAAGKEAYRVLVEKACPITANLLTGTALEDRVVVAEDRVVVAEDGPVKIHCPPPTPTITCFGVAGSGEDETDSSSSPLKLLRNGGGMIPKQRGNRGGMMVSGFVNRSVSHDASSSRVNGVEAAVNAGAEVVSSQSMRNPSRPSEEILYVVQTRQWRVFDFKKSDQI